MRSAGRDDLFLGKIDHRVPAGMAAPQEQKINLSLSAVENQFG